MTIVGNFHLGQVVQHRLYGYRGVIVDVDPEFTLSEDWYQQVAMSKPPRNKPWFRILVHNTAYETYEAEENLQAELEPDKINHPDLQQHFCGYQKGRYVPSISIN
jgi:heat shock protein HspQ